MVEMVSRKRGEREVPWMWTPKNDLKDALKEYNISLTKKARAVAAKQGISEREAREKYGWEKLDMLEFIERFLGTSKEKFERKGVRKSKIEQTYLTPPPTVRPWGRRRGYLARKISMPRAVTRKPITSDSIKALSTRIKGMEYGHGLRIFWDSFEQKISTARQVTDKIVKMIEKQGIPEWPGGKPEQIGFMIKTPEKYRLGFIKHTQYAGTENMYSKLRQKVPKRPREYIKGHIWLLPHIVKRKKPYDIARVILGRDKNIQSTYGNSPSEYFKLTPVE